MQRKRMAGSLVRAEREGFATPTSPRALRAPHRDVTAPVRAVYGSLVLTPSQEPVARP